MIGSVVLFLLIICFCVAFFFFGYKYAVPEPEEEGMEEFRKQYEEIQGKEKKNIVAGLLDDTPGYNQEGYLKQSNKIKQKSKNVNADDYDSYYSEEYYGDEAGPG